MTIPDNASQFRAELRRELRVALKSRQPESVSALRTLIAALDNAEAVPVDADLPRSIDGVIAHASLGVGSTEAARRELEMTDVQAILRELLDDYGTQARQYRSIQQFEAADRLERQADVVRAHLR